MLPPPKPPEPAEAADAVEGEPAIEQKTIPVPMVVGHEFVGEVVELGPAVELDGLGLVVDQAARQALPQCWLEHPEVDPHARVIRVHRRPMGHAAAGGAMPQGQHPVALHIARNLARHAHLRGRAVMPQHPGPPADRAVAFPRLNRIVAQQQADCPAVTGALMLAHRNSSSTHSGTRSLAGPSRVSWNHAEPWLRSRFNSRHRAPASRAVRTRPAAG